MMSFYSAMLALGGTFVIIGIAILFLIVKFLRYNRLSHTITALVFLLGGLAIIVILLAFTSNPQAQRTYFSQMLNLNSEKVKLLTIYDRNNVDDSIIKSSEKQLLEKWISILQSCRAFNPNHPRYEDKYIVMLDDNQGDRFIYEVDIDNKLTNTADLKLREKSGLIPVINYIGIYRCNGLFEFVSEMVTRKE